MIDTTEIAPKVAELETELNREVPDGNYPEVMTHLLSLPAAMADDVAVAVLQQVDRVEGILAPDRGMGASGPRSQHILAFSLGVAFAAAVRRLEEET